MILAASRRQPAGPGTSRTARAKLKAPGPSRLRALGRPQFV